MTRTTLACLLLFAVPLAAAYADGLYRYVDPSGRVVYSDQPPPPSVKDVQSKRLQENVIETDPVPFAARDAAARNPVTLYTFDCDVCKQAEALLAKRGHRLGRFGRSALGRRSFMRRRLGRHTFGRGGLGGFRAGQRAEIGKRLTIVGHQAPTLFLRFIAATSSGSGFCPPCGCSVPV